MKDRTMVETTARERPNGQTHRAERMSGMPPQRNMYTRLVETYWNQYFPDQVTAMEDPEAFFCRQAETLSERVAELEQTLAKADPTPEGEGYLARVGKLTSARMRAEETAIAELLPTPDNDEELTEANKARRRNLGEDENRPNR